MFAKMTYNQRMTTIHATLENPKSRLESPLIWLLSIALITGPLIVLRQNTNDAAWGASIGLFALLVTWSVFAGQQFIREPIWQRNSLAFRVAELILFAVLLRVGTWWIVEGFPNSAEWQQYLIKPWQIFNGIWWLYFILTMLIWLWVNDLIGLFHRLEVSEHELGFYRLPQNERRILRETMLLRTDRSTLSQMFFTRWMLGAIILICCAALSTMNLASFGQSSWFNDLQRFSLSPAMLLTLLIYLFTGFWLLSYSRYTALYGRWLINGTQPHASVAHNWRRTSLLLLASIGLIAAFLPIGSTVPIVIILQAIMGVVAAVGMFLVNLVFMLFALIASLFLGERSPTETIPEPMPVAPPPIMPDMGPSVQREPLIPPAVVGGMTWVLIALGVGIACWFLWQRVGGWAGLRPILAQIRSWWQRTRNGIQDQLTEVRIFVAEQLGREAPLRRTDPRRRLNPDELSAREQIRYFYLQTIKRAKDKGLERQPHQTPAEFLSDLRSEWPESAEDSEDLTEAFLHARYSRSQLSSENVSPIKEVWTRLRSSFQKKRKRGSS